MGGAVYALIGDRRVPLAQLLTQILDIDEGSARQEVALDVLDPRLDLALSLSTIRAAQPRLPSVLCADSAATSWALHLPSS